MPAASLERRPGFAQDRLLPGQAFVEVQAATACRIRLDDPRRHRGGRQEGEDKGGR
jgi:hypothetical protein